MQMWQTHMSLQRQESSQEKLVAAYAGREGISSQSEHDSGQKTKTKQNQKNDFLQSSIKPDRVLENTTDTFLDSWGI